MADVDRIAPPVPALPAPVGRRVDTQRRRRPAPGKPERQDPGASQPAAPPHPSTDHIDEYA
jgi:hypothetical protein